MTIPFVSEDRPLLIPACALICGIATGYAWPAHRIWVSGGGGICLAMWLIRFLKGHPVRFWPALFFLCLGYLLIQPWASPVFAPHHIVHRTDKGLCTIVGRIDSPPGVTHHRQQFNLSVQYLVEKEALLQAIGKLRVTVAQETPVLLEGDTIRFKGHIRAFRNFDNPGGFDYQRFMATQEIWASVYARTDSVTCLERDGEEGLSGGIRRVRRRVSAFLTETASEKSLGIFKTLLLGDRRELPDGLREAFERAGIAHLFAISGLHIGIISGVVFFFCIRGLSFIPFFLWRGWGKRLAAGFALFAVWGYGALAGMSPSTQRAVCMISIFLLSIFVGRSQDLLNTLSAAAIVILIINPPSLLSVSFQLSFAAAGAIIICLQAARADRRKPDASFAAGMRRKLLMFCLVSLSANLGTLPLLMLYFHQVSLIGVLSNFIFVPLIGFIALPLGLFAVSMLSVSPALAACFLQPADWLVAALRTIVEKIAAWPFSAVMTVVPSPMEIGGYYVLALLLIGECIRRKGIAATVRSEETCRWTVFFRAGVLMCVSAMLIDAGYWGYQRFWRRDLRVTVLDVGHGTANLLELPGGKVIMIDGGGFADNALFDIGKNIVAPFLLRKKIRTVDKIFLSHPDSDHLNGLLFIVQHFNVKELKSNNESVDTTAYFNLQDLVREKKILVRDFYSAPRTEMIATVLFRFFYPPADYLERRSRDAWRNTNNNSMVVQVQFGAHTFLFPGDIEAPAERELVAAIGEALKSDVLIAPHHGSRTSGTMGFLNQVRPWAVVFSTGSRPWRPLPHPEVTARYLAVSDRIYATKSHGAVSFSTDGRTLKVSTTTAPREIFPAPVL